MTLQIVCEHKVIGIVAGSTLQIEKPAGKFYGGRFEKGFCNRIDMPGIFFPVAVLPGIGKQFIDAESALFHADGIASALHQQVKVLLKKLP